ncbi:MAG: hypothetical protein RBG13Loki_4263 [Promethearchaeota archaeon CR_4]|nr:MAG: hypothetical protein RBG13Loki_4263 [Candidatus Lokiarchaeota archaeon CR_4]
MRPATRIYLASLIDSLKYPFIQIIRDAKGFNSYYKIRWEAGIAEAIYDLFERVEHRTAKEITRLNQLMQPRPITEEEWQEKLNQFR